MIFFFHRLERFGHTLLFILLIFINCPSKIRKFIYLIRVSHLFTFEQNEKSKLQTDRIATKFRIAASI